MNSCLKYCLDEAFLIRCTKRCKKTK